MQFEKLVSKVMLEPAHVLDADTRESITNTP